MMESEAMKWAVLIGGAARWAWQEFRWWKSAERRDKKVEAELKKQRKAAEKALAKKQAEAFEAHRKKVGLADEGGGSRIGKQARAEWDELQRRREAQDKKP